MSDKLATKADNQTQCLYILAIVCTCTMNVRVAITETLFWEICLVTVSYNWLEAPVICCSCTCMQQTEHQVAFWDSLQRIQSCTSHSYRYNIYKHVKTVNMVVAKCNFQQLKQLMSDHDQNLHNKQWHPKNNWVCKLRPTKRLMT